MSSRIDNKRRSSLKKDKSIRGIRQLVEHQIDLQANLSGQIARVSLPLGHVLPQGHKSGQNNTTHRSYPVKARSSIVYRTEMDKEDHGGTKSPGKDPLIPLDSHRNKDSQHRRDVIDRNVVSSPVLGVHRGWVLENRATERVENRAHNTIKASPKQSQRSQEYPDDSSSNQTHESTQESNATIAAYRDLAERAKKKQR